MANGKLTYAGEEVETIKKVIGFTVAGKATSIPEKEFTLTQFNKKLINAPFEIVHLATHGQFSSNPQDTFILTTPTDLRPDGKVQLNDFDKMFRTRELNRPDNIELLILSACETAAGDDRATLGIAGAAVRAGARSAIASLWSLDDKSSQVFMAEFYHAITQPHTSRAQALRSAQLALLKQDDYNHPRYWAPFLLVGNWL